MSELFVTEEERTAATALLTSFIESPVWTTVIKPVLQANVDAASALMETTEFADTVSFAKIQHKVYFQKKLLALPENLIAWLTYVEGETPPDDPFA